MRDSYLFKDEPLTPVERKALIQDEGFLLWEHVRESLRNRLDTVLPDRHVFVLHALVEAGHGDLLTEEEHQQLADAQEEISHALEEYPALADVSSRIAEERVAFLECWDQPARIYRLRPRTLRMAVAVAAVLIVGFVGTLALWMGSDEQVMFVADGESEQVEFPDGSMALLVDEAEVRFSEKDFERHVDFTGSAFFDVAHSAEPFTVATPSGLATVLGTRFGVRTQGGVTEVVLESGSVALASLDQPVQEVVLRPGTMSRIADGGSPSTPVVVNLMDALGWTGYLFFDATPMEEVVRALANRHGVAITVAPALANEEVSGAFGPNDGPAQILEILATALSATVEGSEDEGLTIRPAR